MLFLVLVGVDLFDLLVGEEVVDLGVVLDGLLEDLFGGVEVFEDGGGTVDGGALGGLAHVVLFAD